MTSPKQFFDQTLKERLAADAALLAASGIRGKRVSIDLAGPQGGKWTLQFGPAGEASLEARQHGGADTHIQMSDETFAGLMVGKVNVASAVLFRKIKISGDMSLAGRCGQALQKLFKV